MKQRQSQRINKIKALMKTYYNRHGKVPPINFIAETMGTSRQTTSRDLLILHGIGFIDYTPHSPYALRISFEDKFDNVKN